MAKRSREPKLECRFFRTESGNEPVRDWLKTLPSATRQEIGSDIRRVQWRWPVGKPLVDGFGDGLYEVRTSAGGEQFRVLFCLDESRMVLLHGFAKKTRKAPAAELALARKRKSQLENAA